MTRSGFLTTVVAVLFGVSLDGTDAAVGYETAGAAEVRAARGSRPHLKNHGAQRRGTKSRGRAKPLCSTTQDDKMNSQSNRRSGVAGGTLSDSRIRAPGRSIKTDGRIGMDVWTASRLHEVIQEVVCSRRGDILYSGAFARPYGGQRLVGVDPPDLVWQVSNFTEYIFDIEASPRRSDNTICECQIGDVVVFLSIPFLQKGNGLDDPVGLRDPVTPRQLLHEVQMLAAKRERKVDFAK